MDLMLWWSPCLSTRNSLKRLSAWSWASYRASWVRLRLSSTVGQVRNKMNKMNRLIEQLKRHEGVKNHVYQDINGLEHIGVGRNISANGLGLSDEEIDYLLSNDILRCIKELSAEYAWFGNLDEIRQESTINIFFNLGATRFRGFKKAIAAMEAADYKLAATEFLDRRWSKQVGSRALELTDIIRAGS